MSYEPCRKRTFRLELGSVYDYVRSEYSHWLMHLTERLGCELTLEIWKDAFSRYDVGSLEQMLSAGWSKAPTHCTVNEADRPMEGILKVLFSGREGSTDKDKDQDIVLSTHPLPQIQGKLTNGPMHKAITTYEAIHLYCHGFALISEALIDRLGCKGELMAYDIRLEEIVMAGFEKLSVEEFIRRRCERFTGDPGEPDMHSAGLEVELISSNEREILTHTKECEWVRYYGDRHPRVGYLMCCSTDDAAYRAINDRLRLQRTTTLMEGGSCCDFRIYGVD